MNLPRSVRVLIAMAILVLALAVLLLVLTISEATLTIQAHLAEAPPWLALAWWGVVGLIGLAFGWLLLRILRPSSRAADEPPAQPLSESQLKSEIAKAEEAGTDISAALAELRELQNRRAGGDIHIALFGEVSTGKSALVNALLPSAEAVSNISGGTTKTLTRYSWISPGGDQLQIVDMPGTDEANGTLDRLATDEAKRAHIVLYITDSDINRRQHDKLQELLALHKPLVLVLNKGDRYSEDDAAKLATRLRAIVEGHPKTYFVQTSAATSRQVIRQLPDGSEQKELHPVAPRVEALASTLQRLLDGEQQILEQLRDSATFVLAKQKLDIAHSEARRQKAEKLVDRFAVKAVVGAMAAITPGSDLLIQGFLGTQLVKQLGDLYDTRIAKVDTDLLMELVQRHVGRAHTLLLAVAGNALKAFPGIGTLAGGAMHAVAYGIIFHTLGRALMTTLETRGELHPRQTAKLFEENLGEDLESSARSLARVVIAQSKGGKPER